jgi:hypothetical protein
MVEDVITNIYDFVEGGKAGYCKVLGEDMRKKMVEVPITELRSYAKEFGIDYDSIIEILENGDCSSLKRSDIEDLCMSFSIQERVPNVRIPKEKLVEAIEQDQFMVLGMPTDGSPCKAAENQEVLCKLYLLSRLCHDFDEAE